jgi:hypothetical protein
MIRAEQIPDEVVEAAAKSMGWTSAIALPQDKLRFKGHIAAALNAWPDVYVEKHGDTIILPVPQDKVNG